jgi:hypothetical protein
MSRPVPNLAAAPTACALCREPAVLRRSHIVPELLHRPIYDDKHQLEVVRCEAVRATTLRKGLRERLLCDACEHRIKKFEDYFAASWYSNPACSRAMSADLTISAQFEYGLLKLFVLSILWRASASRLPDFSEVNLGPHQERMRRQLLDEGPGPADEYPIYAGLIYDLATQRRWDNVLLPPVRIKVESRWAYRMVFGGASWTVVVSGRGPLTSDSMALKEDGRIGLTVCDWKRFARLSGAVAAVRGLPEA